MARRHKPRASIPRGSLDARRICPTHKVRYASAEAASFYALADGSMRAYYCHLCEGFHLTSQSKRRS